MKHTNLETEEQTPQSPKSSYPKTLIISLLIVSILTSVGSSYFFSKQVSKEVTENYLALEYKKSGGKENYELITEAQRLQLEQQIPQIREFVKGWGSPQAEWQEAATAEPKKLSQDELASIKKDAYIEGNASAKITLIEYSDLECPFCIRQFKEGTIKKVHEKYGDTVNSIFKNFRGVPHENAEIEAVAALCAWQVGGTEKYASYYQAILGRSNGGNGTGFSKDALVPLAKEVGLDMKKFQACFDTKATLSRFDAETTEGKKLGVSGTPWTVIINNETGEYMLIAWAYPVSEFERVISKLLK
jgi:protein-disulfide isomerase